MSGNCRNAAWVCEADVLTVFGTFVGESASKSFEMSNQLPSLHSDLKLFD